MRPEVQFRRMPEPCVGAVVFWDGELLLIQRGQDPGAGQWSLPGGRLEPRETWQDAVEREVKEETCLEVNCGEFVGWVEREASGRRYLIADFFATTDDPSAAVPGDDAQDLAFVAANQINRFDLTVGLKDFLLQHRLMTP